MIAPRWPECGRIGARAEPKELPGCLCRPGAAQAVLSIVAGVSAGILSTEQVLALLDACGTDSPSGLRARALIVAPWRGGLRLGELLALQPEDLDADRGTLAVRGPAARVVQLDAGAAAVLDAWRRARAQRVRETAPLLCTWRGGGLDGSYVRRELRAIARRAGIREPVSPEVLRRSLAAELAGEGYSLSDIRAQLGQANLRSVAAYLPDAAPGPDAPARLAQRPWPGHRAATSA